MSSSYPPFPPWGSGLACPERHKTPSRNSLASNRHTGLTLFEVLIASALTAVLLAALWSMLTIYASLYDTGKSKTEHAQLARALQKRLTDDLMSACMGSTGKPRSRRNEPTPSAEGSDQTDSSRASGEPSTFGTPSPIDRQADSSRDVGPNNGGAEGSAPPRVSGFSIDSASFGGGPTASAQRVGLVGTSTSLVLDVIVPIDPYVYVGVESDDVSEALPTTFSRVPELQRVTYTFTGTSALLTDTSLSPTSSASTSSSGLVRRQSTWEQAFAASSRTDASPSSSLSTASQADSEEFAAWDTIDEALTDDLPTSPGDGTQSAVAENEPIVDEIPEVTNFQIRYFDGAVWLSQWNSRREKSLPVAIEIQFDLRQESKPGLQPGPADGTSDPNADAALESDDPYASDADLATEMDDMDDIQWPDDTSGLLDAEQLPQHRFVIYLDRNDTTRQATMGPPTTGLPMTEFEEGPSP